MNYVFVEHEMEKFGHRFHLGSVGNFFSVAGGVGYHRVIAALSGLS